MKDHIASPLFLDPFIISSLKLLLLALREIQNDHFAKTNHDNNRSYFFYIIT